MLFVTLEYLHIKGLCMKMQEDEVMKVQHCLLVSFNVRLKNLYVWYQLKKYS